MTDRAIAERAAFDLIRYGSVWEDADVLCSALEPVAANGRLLSIASAGDNALALLTLDPAEVVAVDLSHAQLAAVALRIAAFRALDHTELLAFLGVTEGADRVATYHRLAPLMPDDARAFWNAREADVRAGVIHAGKFERYFRIFRYRVLPLVHRRARIDALLRQRTTADQRRFYREEWDTVRWRLVFRVFFSRLVMGRLGRDPAFFDHVEGSVGERILERTRYALTEIPVGTNPYLTYIMTGNYGASALPRYLRAEHFEAIRARVERVRLVRGSAEQCDGPFDGFNLSDIFEYMSDAEHRRTYGALLEQAAPGARIAYWNMLAPRRAPAEFEGRVERLASLSSELHAQDRAWFYSAFHVDRVAS